MADSSKKHTENVRGRYYVDKECIDCDLCRVTAPDNFSRTEGDKEGAHSYVSKQPKTPKEEELCNDALVSCPVDAIGNDGE